LKVPFRNLLVFPNQAPWPGRLRDSIPLNLRCRTRTRVAEKRPASHTNALGELFIPDEGGCAQQEVCTDSEFTVLVRAAFKSGRMTFRTLPRTNHRWVPVRKRVASASTCEQETPRQASGDASGRRILRLRNAIQRTKRIPALRMTDLRAIFSCGVWPAFVGLLPGRRS
jgi:hypothetical protein